MSCKMLANVFELPNEDALHLRMQMCFRLLNKNQMNAQGRLSVREFLEELKQLKEDKD